MFSNNRNILITGGSFIENHDAVIQIAKPSGIDLLLKASAPGAFHDSGERFDPPKCHPNTRIAVLRDIMKWVIREVGWDGFILWLYGPAGSGKSAIAQTIAELCYGQNRLLASFFFSRTDPNRNHEKSLVASLAYQIALTLPPSRALIEAAVANDPAIFQKSLEAQFTSLIAKPLLQLTEAGLLPKDPYPQLVIIDGLDECQGSNVQRYILDIISRFLQEHRIPLMFLIASRREPHISIGFSTPTLDMITVRLALDDEYRAHDDIDRFLRDSFCEIKVTHPLKAFIPSNWPSASSLNTIIDKSSGQFIYASTVVKYVSSIHHQPRDRLEVVLGIRPPSNDTPFAELDALYRNILSSLADVESTLRVLGVIILPREELINGGYFDGLDFLERFLLLNPGDVQRLLLDLGSIIKIEHGFLYENIRILHASFGDFLLDRNRSKEYYVDPLLVHTELAKLCLQIINQWNIDGNRQVSNITNYASLNLVRHCSMAYATAELREEILKTPILQSLLQFPYHMMSRPIDIFEQFLSFLKSSALSNRRELCVYQQMPWDEIMHSRLNKIRSDRLLTTCIVLTDPDFHAPTDVVKDSLHMIFQHSELADLAWIYSFSSSHFQFPLTSVHHALLLDFLLDSGRAGRHHLDSTKYATAAVIFLDRLSDGTSDLRLLDIHWGHLITRDRMRAALSTLELIFSKSAYSEELIRRVTNLHLNSYCAAFPRLVLSVKDAIVAYLVRVCGSAPEVHIAIEEEEE